MSNEELCQDLESYYNVCGSNLEAFRTVDRGNFVAETDRLFVYTNSAFKTGPVHLSAPHIYVHVLEGLDLKHGEVFLNVGSGTGYLCCLAWYQMGKQGSVHGIEISPTLVDFSLNNISRFLSKQSPDHDPDSIQIVTGNCFDINRSRAARQYDKIYIGAGCREIGMEFFYPLLAEGGTMLVPITERHQMMKILKKDGKIITNACINNVIFAPLVEYTDEGSANVQYIPPASLYDLFGIAIPEGIEGASLRSRLSNRLAPEVVGKENIQLPSIVWEPKKVRHRQFPVEFREMVQLLLLASSQSRPATTKTSSSSVVAARCLCSWLPTPVWFHILSFARRDWFTPVVEAAAAPQSDSDSTRDSDSDSNSESVPRRGARRDAEDDDKEEEKEE